MIILLFVVHVMIALALIGVVLLQKSEGGALGMGGGGGMSGFMTGRSTANLLTRVTAFLAIAFFSTSILLVVLHNPARAPTSIIDRGGPSPVLPTAPAAPAGSGAPVSPPTPAEPSAPLAR
jgi:preprotein translocase subunit SecG